MMQAVPTIDLARLESEPEENRRDEISLLRRACRQFGFFQLTNHDVPTKLQDEILVMAKQLFDLPEQVKRELSIHLSPTSKGQSTSIESY